MAKFLDEIQEELKREDLMVRLRKALPYIGVMIALVLAGTGVYSWCLHRQEQKLIVDESAYQRAWDHAQKGETDQALTILDALIQDKSKLSSLCQMRKTSLENQRAAGQIQKDAPAQSVYQPGTLATLSPLVDTLFTVLSAFQTVGAEGGRFAAPMAGMLSPEHTWYLFALAWKALQGQAASDPNTQENFQKWAQVVQTLPPYRTPPAMKWISLFATLGRAKPGPVAFRPAPQAQDASASDGGSR